MQVLPDELVFTIMREGSRDDYGTYKAARVLCRRYVDDPTIATLYTDNNMVLVRGDYTITVEHCYAVCGIDNKVIRVFRQNKLVLFIGPGSIHITYGYDAIREMRMYREIRLLPLPPDWDDYSSPQDILGYVAWSLMTLIHAIPGNDHDSDYLMYSMTLVSEEAEQETLKEFYRDVLGNTYY